METTILTEKYDGLIKKIANKFYNVSFEDLYQAGVIGLLKAYKNYQDNTSAKFSTYAHDYIFGEMYQLVISNRALKTNKETLKLYKEIEKVREFLTQKLNRNPSTLEIALFLEIDEHTINDAINSSIELLSLDASFTDDNTPLHEIIKGNEYDYDQKILLEDSIAMLPSPEKEIIIARYLKDMTQTETATNLGLSQVMVSRMEKKSLKLLRNYLAS